MGEEKKIFYCKVASFVVSIMGGIVAMILSEAENNKMKQEVTKEVLDQVMKATTENSTEVL